ncbi:hypothetical protein B0H16DRAFT_1480622 [Mycena metata]|uniref:Uncharacterized protein n=1 Tax=Mycena metata TaxID=1033252 RepID=A0AAD7H491_9AGAR|nr:hypothetical protein B0H16DRAFT_1480622 [Mycena metata]
MSSFPGRRTRSGAEYSPFANTVALRLADVHLANLLRHHDEGPDSDTESLNDSDADGDDDAAPAQPFPRKPDIPPPRPSTFIRVAPPGHPPGTRLPNGLMPGSATAAEVKARCLVKKHQRDRLTRSLKREQLRTSAGCRLKHRLCQAAALQLKATIADYAAPVAASGWQAIRQDELNARAHSLEEIQRERPDMLIYDWDGAPTPVIDADCNILLLLGGFPPDDPTWSLEVAQDAAQQMEAAAIEIYSGPKWRRKAGLNGPAPRRGSHAAKHVGAAIGGGQRCYPMNLAHGAQNLLVFARLFGLKSFQRIAGWTNMLFMAFAPNLHEFYCTTYAALCDWDRLQACAKHIVRNFKGSASVFTTVTLNFGPITVTLPHIDFGNLAWGWCTVTALGNFNPDRGGHLILWDLNLLIRFPPGSTILLPSAILRHSNLKISPNKTRFSFTQFTPAGIFRWVYNDFRTDKDINSAKSTMPEEHEQRKRDWASRWQEGIRMYRKWDGPVM